MSLDNIRQASSPQIVPSDRCSNLYRNRSKEFLPICSNVSKSGDIPSAIKRAKIGLASHFLCSRMSLRLLRSESSPNKSSRSCFLGKAVSSRVSKLLKYSSRAKVALTTSGISAIVPAFLRTTLLNTRQAIKNASACPAIAKALTRDGLRGRGLDRFGVVILRGILARLFILRFAFQNFRARHGDNFFGQRSEFFKLSRFGWFHGETLRG
jgi:hypothetical protein